MSFFCTFILICIIVIIKSYFEYLQFENMRNQEREENYEEDLYIEEHRIVEEGEAGETEF